MRIRNIIGMLPIIIGVTTLLGCGDDGGPKVDSTPRRVMSVVRAGMMM